MAAAVADIRLPDCHSPDQLSLQSLDADHVRDLVVANIQYEKRAQPNAVFAVFRVDLVAFG